MSGTNESWGTTGFYTIPQVLSLSDDTGIETILADIPFFSVGLLGFGVITFFFAMRRVSALSAYLYGSVVVAFLAGILDLSQLLAQGRSGRNSVGANLGSVGSLVVAREIGFSLSIGLRLLFFWAFVATKPHGETSNGTATDSEKMNFMANNSSRSFVSRQNGHSGSWRHWGLLGALLKYKILAMIFVITVMQMIWRVVSDLDMFGPVYEAEATLEIVASAFLILKLFLNMFLTPVEPRSRVLKYYAAPLVALGINMALGIANLATFAFSESILGRFLQAVELYILIVFLLISTFYDLRDIETPSPADRGISSETFRGLPDTARVSTFRISPPNIPTLKSDELRVSRRSTSLANLANIGIPPPASLAPPMPERRASSTISRISSWVADKRASRRRSDEARLWDQNQAERGASPPMGEAYDRTSEPMYNSPQNDGPKMAQGYQDPMYTNDTVTPAPRPPFAQPPVSAFSVDTMDESPRPPLPKLNTGIAPSAYRQTVSPVQPSAFSVSSYYTKDYAGDDRKSMRLAPPVPPFVPRDTGSPVYGLERSSLRDRDRLSRRSTINSIEDLLRQQRELDKSIATLRLFSPRDSAIGFPDDLREEKKDIGDSSSSASASLSRSASLAGQVKPDSGSARSEFSLSHFPPPPRLEEAPALPSAPILRNRASEVPAAKMAAPDVLSPPVRPFAGGQVLPGSPRRESEDTIRATSREPRVNSSGTQYDVTSFIGDLTVPPSNAKRRLSQDQLTDISEGGSTQTTQDAAIVTAQSSTSVRPLFFGVARPAGRTTASGLSLVTASPGGPSGPRYLSPQSQRPSPADTLESSRNTITRVPSANSSLYGTYSATANARLAAGGAARSAQGLPSRPRLLISGPRPPPPDGKGESAPGAFERPRPPPLILDQAAPSYNQTAY
ncbi:hypothetical protein PLICRDRAFT_121653 [Plicaturopsis crispa FD-325 SS-3]|nr:hypothetical protein PLICRDRAFT_121653 [Plicaturopsis crispa FD-325 SS-3]